MFALLYLLVVRHTLCENTCNDKRWISDKTHERFFVNALTFSSIMRLNCVLQSCKFIRECKMIQCLHISNLVVLVAVGTSWKIEAEFNCFTTKMYNANKKYCTHSFNTPISVRKSTTVHFRYFVHFRYLQLLGHIRYFGDLKYFSNSIYFLPFQPYH